jgi:hypothetical protein
MVETIYTWRVFSSEVPLKPNGVPLLVVSITRHSTLREVSCRQCGFTVPRGEQAHGYLWLRLSNCSHVDVKAAGGNLQILRRNRNWADYDFDAKMDQGSATAQIQVATDIIRVLEAAAQNPIKTQITDAMKIYERDVLKTVTWHP